MAKPPGKLPPQSCLMTKSTSTRRKRPSLELVDAKEAVDLATAQSYSENVFLFVPNLIGMSSFLTCLLSFFIDATSFVSGYSRVILAGLSLYYMSYHPIYCTILYGFSCLLDAVDGQAARALGQTSKFGAVLDMVTDRYVFIVAYFIQVTYFPSRCTTSCLLCYLSSAYPTYAVLFQFLITLDFSSHYMHMYRYVTHVHVKTVNRLTVNVKLSCHWFNKS